MWPLISMISKLNLTKVQVTKARNTITEHKKYVLLAFFIK